MTVALGLTQHLIVFCTDKQERAVAVEALLATFGCKVIVATGMHQALKLMAQELPHLVISEALLADGSAGNLFDKMQGDKYVSKIPVMVHILKKSKDELGALTGRKFAGFFMGPFEPKGFGAKVMEVINTVSPISPFFYRAGEVGLYQDLTMQIEAEVLGKSNDQIIAKSGSELDSRSAFVCVPQKAELEPVLLRQAGNMRSADTCYNLFPLTKAVGKGRLWLEKLPEMNLENLSGADAEGKNLRKVIFYDPNAARADEFGELLKGYGIQLIYAKSPSAAASLLKRDGETIDGIYLHELLNDASSVEWKNTYAKCPINVRPPLIIGTTAQNPKSTDSTRYIRRPFGLGLLVEMMQSMFFRASSLDTAAQSYAGSHVSFRAPAKLLGLDETGGVLQSQTPLMRGSKVQLVHDQLSKLWQNNTVVTISGVGPLPDKPEVWQARFDVIPPGSSKTKYFNQLSELLEQGL